jgi:hypothetical protein
MKALSITGFIIGILSFLASMYVQFVLAPAEASLQADMDSGEFSELTNDLWMAVHETLVTLGEVLVIAGGLALILSVIPAIKTKSKLAWVGTILSLVALLIGVINGTHMFS